MSKGQWCAQAKYVVEETRATLWPTAKMLSRRFPQNHQVLNNRASWWFAPKILKSVDSSFVNP